jgi:hypothetical protein
MTPHEPHVRAAVHATAIHLPSSFSWFGKRPRPIPRRIQRVLPLQVLRSYLVATLQEQLYTQFYCRGFAAPLRWETREPDAIASAGSLVAKLSAANCGKGFWSSGWVIDRLEEGGIAAVQSGLELRVGAADFRTADDRPAAIGERVFLRYPKELAEISPGFHVATSDTDLPLEDWRQLVRLYWNVTPGGAVELMRRLTKALNRAKIPFRLKVLRDRARFVRCDSAVLFFRKDDYKAVRDTIETAYAALVHQLRPEIPVFTKPLAPGLGLAEEPSQAGSFGQSRCLLMAEGIVRAHEAGCRSVNQRLAFVKQRFAEENIDWGHPYLNSDSIDAYPFTSRHNRSTVDGSRAAGFRRGAEAWLRAADRIGSRLCADAIWHEDRCNWVGISTRDPSGRTYSGLGPDLYAGTAGVGLFLAELYRATGDTLVLGTAKGAIRQALAREECIPAAQSLGLFTGATGIAFAALRASLLWCDDELVAATHCLLDRHSRAYRPNRDLDVMSGNAGAVMALLALPDSFATDRHLELAVRLGEELVSSAIASRGGCSWRTINAANQYHLTGMSHGTAGIGLSLIELFVATGDTRYRSIAEGAFNYERHWFDPVAGNWPDLREASRTGAAQRPVVFSTYWCHGAPGIGLSRLRAYQVLGVADYRDEALAALKQTGATVRGALRSRVMNFSLCHGLAGNADILLTGSRMLPDRLAGAALIADEIADAGISLYAESGEWPCGTAGTDGAPGLMIGSAGIGYFYLRMYNQSVPPVLLLRGEPASRSGIAAKTGRSPERKGVDYAGHSDAI